jgi:ketosteroid isomerase-like protein
MVVRGNDEMNEQDHIALVRRSLDAWSNPDRRAEYFQLYAPDAVLHGYPGVEPGLDSIKRFYETFWRAFPDAVATIETAFADADKVACSVNIRATHQTRFKASRRPENQSVCRRLRSYVSRMAGASNAGAKLTFSA